MRYYLELALTRGSPSQATGWVDAAGETIYVVNEGDPPALPFAPCRPQGLGTPRRARCAPPLEHLAAFR